LTKQGLIAEVKRLQEQCNMFDHYKFHAAHNHKKDGTCLV
jgi:hypothetical protein